MSFRRHRLLAARPACCSAHYSCPPRPWGRGWLRTFSTNRPGRLSGRGSGRLSRAARGSRRPGSRTGQFSLTLLTILLAHEMGHYLACVRYGLDASLPYFMPFPSLIGTLGAFIRIRSPIYSRRVLFDVGIAGPLAGFAAGAAGGGHRHCRFQGGPGHRGARRPDLRHAAACSGFWSACSSRRVRRRHLASPRGASRLGRRVRHGLEPAADRAARRRAHPVRVLRRPAPAALEALCRWRWCRWASSTGHGCSGPWFCSSLGCGIR